MAVNDEQYQLAEQLQYAYQCAQKSDHLASSERDAVTERIRDSFTYNLSEAVQKNLDAQAESRRAAKESVGKSPYCFG
jgi:uncharacterized membrane protein YccC